MNTANKILTFFTGLLLASCDVEYDNDWVARKSELDASTAATETARGDEAELQPGDGDKQYTVESTTKILLADDVGYVIEPKTQIAYLDDGLTGFQCRCASGCSESSPCYAEGSTNQLYCHGICAGTSDDGVGCGSCAWHTTPSPPGPTDTAGAGLDPADEPFDKPPGIDPTAGELDPTHGPELPKSRARPARARRWRCTGRSPNRHLAVGAPWAW